MQEQTADLQQQLQTLQEQQAGNSGTAGTADGSAADTGAHNTKPVRNVKVPDEGVYTMRPDHRTYRKDVADYQILTQYSDGQVVMRMRLNMDIEKVS